MTLEPIHVYGDETGDLGAPPGSSPVLGMASVLVRNEAAASALRFAVQTLRADFGVPVSKILSWKDHVKTHARRLHAADVLSKLDGVKVVYVFVQKDRVVGEYVRERGLLYNYVAGKAYKSILWAARNWNGPSATVVTRFGHIRGFDHSTTKEYFQEQLGRDPKVPLHMERGLRWVASDKYLESQAADLYAGFLRAAVWPDEYGFIEGRYIKQVWHQVRDGGTCKIPLGFMAMPTDTIARSLEWWDCACHKCA